MKRTDFERWPCSIARTVNVVGDWWSPLILRDIFYGNHRFDMLQSNLAISRNILNQRLVGLVEQGIVVRSMYQERPKRYEYHLTEKGAELLPVLVAMMKWGNRWQADPDRPFVRLRHRCGETTEGVVVCEHCGEPLTVHGLKPEPGPAMDLERLGPKSSHYFED